MYRDPELCAEGERPAGVAPELDLMPRPRAMPQGPLRRPPTAEELEKLMGLRDEFAKIASAGRFNDAASREWRELPHNWRMALLMVAGVGTNVDELSVLASRGWRELPEPERSPLRAMFRTGKHHLGRVTALAARV